MSAKKTGVADEVTRLADNLADSVARETIPACRGGFDAARSALREYGLVLQGKISSLEVENAALKAQLSASRGTDAQILKERELTGLAQKMARLIEGLENGNSSAEYAALQLAIKMRDVVAAEGGAS